MKNPKILLTSVVIGVVVAFLSLSTYVFAGKEAVYKIPQITQFQQIGKEQFSLTIDNYTAPVWFCAQEDWYTKPNSCNNGYWSMNSSYEKVFLWENDRFMLNLYADAERTTVYDSVIATRITWYLFNIKETAHMCWKMTRNKIGNFFINKKRLLTKPWWKALLPFVGVDVCVDGILYKQSFRVYFIKENKKK